MQFRLDTVGLANYRAAQVNGRVAAALGILHMGQWWGGKRVPVASITAVGIAPDQGGTGVGKALIRAMLHEIRAAGVPLSVLYPSPLGFYRTLGYERAGTRIIYGAPLHAIGRSKHGMTIVALEPPDRHAVLRRLHETHAPFTPGKLDRAPFSWERLLAMPETIARTYAVLHAHAPQGYIIFVQPARQGEALAARDFCALTPQAGQRLLTLLGDHRTMVSSITWDGTLNDPIATVLPEQHAKITNAFDWMLRIVDVGGALTARGYHPEIRAELHLDLRDDVLHENQGRYVVRIAAGAATVERGGTGAISLDVRDLAAIYTAQHSPFERRYTGTIDGADAALARLGFVFAGPPPRMNDMF